MSHQFADADARLESLASRDYQPEDAGAGLAAIAEATAVINREIAAEYARAGAVGAEGFAAGTLGDRLQAWIDRLYELVQKIAAALRALSYSISVSVPLGVSVSVSWS